MKISRKDLKELYKDYLEDKSTLSKAKCPSPQDIAACLRGESFNKGRNKLIDHIFKCSSCREEFELILGLIREEKKLIHDLNTIIQEKTQRKENKVFKFRSFRPAWIYGFVFVMGVVLISVFVHNVLKEPKYRSAESRSVTLITPNKKTIPKKQLEFEWIHVLNSDYYILEIFDESLCPIWESDQITVNHASIPEKITNKLLNQKRYYWMVTAFLSDGKTIESRLQDFVISD